VTRPLVSVVVPTAGRADALERCLDALGRQTCRRFEILVVADGGAAPAVGARFAELRTLALAERRGFGAAVNAGAAAGRGRYLAVLNDDAEPEPAWLEELLRGAARHPRAAAVATKVLRRDDPSVLDGCGDALTQGLKAYRRGLGEVDRGQYDAEEQVFSASGTAALWRIDAFRALGGFDEAFLAYYEDVDLGLRARARGFECWYAPQARALHEGAGTASADWAAFESFHAVRNRWLAIAKTVPRAWILRKLHLVLAGEVLSLARALARGELRLMLRAYRDVLRTRRGAAPSERIAVAELRRLTERRLPPLRMSLWRLRWARGRT
jgi:GT2 family glycosyltransferase